MEDMREFITDNETDFGGGDFWMAFTRSPGLRNPCHYGIRFSSDEADLVGTALEIRTSLLLIDIPLRSHDQATHLLIDPNTDPEMAALLSKQVDQLRELSRKLWRLGRHAQKR